MQHSQDFDHYFLVQITATKWELNELLDTIRCKHWCCTDSWVCRRKQSTKNPILWPVYHDLQNQNAVGSRIKPILWKKCILNMKKIIFLTWMSLLPVLDWHRKQRMSLWHLFVDSASIGHGNLQFQSAAVWYGPYRICWQQLISNH